MILEYRSVFIAYIFKHNSIIALISYVFIYIIKIYCENVRAIARSSVFDILSARGKGKERGTPLPLVIPSSPRRVTRKIYK